MAGVFIVLVLLLLLPQRLASGRNRPIRTFTFEDRGPEIARLCRLGLENDLEHVATFCEALKSEDLDVRRAATAQLVFTHDESAFDAVVAAMDDESTWVRRGAIAVLEKLGDTRAIPVLEAALTHTLYSGSGSFRRTGPANSSVLQQNEHFNRMAAALALHRLGSRAGRGTALEVLKRESAKPVLQMAAKCAVLMDLKEATPELLRIARECEAFGEDSPGTFAIRALRIMGDPACADEMVQLAKEKFDYPGGFARMEALNLLVLHGGQDVGAILRDAIGTSDWPQHRRLIVMGLRKFRPPDAARLLTEHFLKPRQIDEETGQIDSFDNHRVFYMAAEAVADLGDPSVLPDLKHAYEQFIRPTDVFHLRLHLAYAIAGLGDEFGLKELHEALGHGDAAVRRLAAKRLGDLGSTGSLAPLTAALEVENERVTFRAMKSALAKLGAGPTVLERHEPPLPAPPADAYAKPRYLHVTFDDCTTIESMERLVGLIEELAELDVRWAPRMYVAALSRHDFEYATMLLQRCFDRGCEFENHSLHHNPDGQSLRSRTPDQVRLDCGGGMNWLHGNIMGCDRIYHWKGGGGGFHRPWDPVISREELSQAVSEAFWAKNVDYNWRSVEKLYPDYYAPPYHFIGESPVASWAVNSDLSYGFEADSVEEAVKAFVESLDSWYFQQPETVFELSGHDWTSSPIPIRLGHHMHWDVLSGFLRQVLVNRRDRYPLLYSMTALEMIHMRQRGLAPEDVLTQKVHLQNSPEF